LHELLEANVRQSADPLRNCDRVLSSLLEGWTAALAQMTQTAVAESPAEPSGTDPESGIPDVAPLAVMPAPARFAPAPYESPSDEDNEGAFDIEDLQPAMNSWCG
jgi:hypothetical protein